MKRHQVTPINVCAAPRCHDEATSRVVHQELRHRPLLVCPLHVQWAKRHLDGLAVT